LFYQDPPFILRPRAGTSQNVTDAKTALFSVLLDECGFKTETKWGLEQMAHLGTGIWKWGIKYTEKITKKRIAKVTKLTTGPAGAETNTMIPSSDPPEIEITRKLVPRPFIESREISKVLVDPHCQWGDIRRANYAIDVRFMDFYELRDLKRAMDKLPEGHPDKDGWLLPDEKELMEWWMPPTDAGQPNLLVLDQAAYIRGVVLHSEG